MHLQPYYTGTHYVVVDLSSLTTFYLEPGEDHPHIKCYRAYNLRSRSFMWLPVDCLDLYEMISGLALLIYTGYSLRKIHTFFQSDSLA